MLLNLREYHRPAAGGTGPALERALALLARREIHTVPLAGGDTLVGSADPAIEAVVDLQGLGLDFIRREEGPGSPLRIGAMATRARLAEDENAARLYGGILVQGAQRRSGSVQRRRATVGGAVVIAGPDDPLVAALLACDAHVVIYSGAGYRQWALSDFLPARAAILAEPGLITELSVPLPAGATGGALASVARTLADAPIVLAAAVLALENGRCTSARLALGGVAAAPVRAPAAEAALAGQEVTGERIAAAAAACVRELDPTGDFRGSAAYRRALAPVLAERALRAAWEQVA